MAAEDTGRATVVLALAFTGETDAARERAASALADPGISADARAALVAATAFADYVDARFAEALVSSRRSVVLAREASAGVRFLAATTQALGLANEPDFAATEPAALADALDGSRAIFDLPQELRWLSAALLVEACFANGQIASASQALELRDGQEPPRHAQATFASMQGVRVALFANDMVLARERCEGALAELAQNPLDEAEALTRAFLALIAAYQNQVDVAEIHVEAVRALVDTPRRWPDGGALTVAGYALAGLDRFAEARPLVLAGGGGPDLHLSQLVDRALGFDVLVAAAIEDRDLRAAELWARRARELHANPAASLAVERIDARLALAMGNAADSADRAAQAGDGARAAGRFLEASAADLARARAMIAQGQTGVAIPSLQHLAHESEAAGTLVLRERAVGELRRLGRRLDPRPGAGIAALSPRELEVAALAAEGFTSRHIAQSLFLSERTVNAHLRRALRAMGVSTRASLPAAFGPALERAHSQPLADVAQLTERQRAVAQLVHEGQSNAEIAAALGISVKTVEKHVAMIFERWGVSTRTGIARMVADTQTQ
ncbi:MAG: LuxR C-terminal-related transcriptional regulator [Demequina sp.]|nr:LuxR C-terminal-related transcriptional regulator [Demequina sp.]